MKKNKKILIAIITIVIIILAGVFIFKNSTFEKNGNKKDEYQDYIPQEEITEKEEIQTKINLYFVNSDTGELESETRILNAKDLLENPYKQIMELLIKGPQSTNLKSIIPKGTVLHEVKVENNCAIINVSKEFLEYEKEEDKLKAIQSVVDTITNLKEIQEVKFLINGESNEKLQDVYVRAKQQ